MQLVLLSALLLFSVTVSAQPEEVKVFTKVELNSGPDPAAWSAFLNRHKQLPDTISRTLAKGDYEMVIEVLVNVHGDAGPFKVVKSVSPLADAYYLKLVRSFKGPWKPASQCGRLVNSYNRLPVRFRVE